MADREARSLAWFRKKRRIIQSQSLIVALQCLTVAGMLPLGTVIFWLIFCVSPSVVIPLLLIVWAVSFSVYIAGNVVVRLKEKTNEA